eukprot:4185830-Pyramimonas_sp.AAC.1
MVCSLLGRMQHHPGVVQVLTVLALELLEWTIKEQRREAAGLPSLGGVDDRREGQQVRGSQGGAGKRKQGRSARDTTNRGRVDVSDGGDVDGAEADGSEGGLASVGEEEPAVNNVVLVDGEDVPGGWLKGASNSAHHGTREALKSIQSEFERVPDHIRSVLQGALDKMVRDS